jgi:hypothetical protein
VDFQNQNAEAEDNLSPMVKPPEDLKGKFIIVNYDYQPFVGQVLKVVGEEMEISYMQQAAEREFICMAPSSEHHILLQVGCPSSNLPTRAVYYNTKEFKTLQLTGKCLQSFIRPNSKLCNSDGEKLTKFQDTHQLGYRILHRPTQENDIHKQSKKKSMF